MVHYVLSKIKLAFDVRYKNVILIYYYTHLVVLVLILVSASKANCLALISRTVGLTWVLKMLASNALLV